MQRSKYYTPSIEEFHVGFEYRLKGEEVVRTLTTNCTVDTELSEVKHLDREDIESLGWVGQKANSVYFKKGKYRLVHWMDKPVRLVTIIEEYTGGEEIILRKAMVKNKSELKKLLKQLGVK
tara:strand:+ start:1341 stop:1703 length:363 start_codon:yes stop_codon:yes gene_type:complete